MVTLRHIAPLALLVACGGRPTGAAPPRTAQTVVTSCPDEAPTLSDDVEQTRLVLGRVIERICVIGSSSTEQYAGILRSRGVREGQPLTPDGVGRTLETILASPVVDDASIAAEPRGEGVVVYIHVTERPRLDEIVFEGSKVFGDDKLNGRAPFEKGEPIDRHVVHAFIQGIKDEYVTIGYAGVTVEPILEPMAPPAKGHARLRLVIHEGPLYKIAKLSFPGASKLTEEELKKAISVVEGNILDEGRLERAPMLLEAAYLDRGMIKASAGRPKQEASATGAVSVTFPISEGEVTKSAPSTSRRPEPSSNESSSRRFNPAQA